MPFDGKTNEEIAKAIDSGRYSMDHRVGGWVGWWGLWAGLASAAMC